MSLIPIGDAAHILRFTLLHSHCRLNLLGEVFAVIVVDEIFEGNIHADSFAFVLGTVIVIVDGHEADSEERKDMLQIITDLKVISSKTREVFDHNATDLALFCILDHSREVRTIKICTGEPIITELNTREIAEQGILV